MIGQPNEPSSLVMYVCLHFLMTFLTDFFSFLELTFKNKLHSKCTLKRGQSFVTKASGNHNPNLIAPNRIVAKEMSSIHQ